MSTCPECVLYADLSDVITLNIEPNLKVAVEVVRAAEAPLIPIGHRLNVQHVKEHGAGDYTTAGALVLRALGCMNVA